MAYPTPPPTSSPKDNANHGHVHDQYEYHPQNPQQAQPYNSQYNQQQNQHTLQSLPAQETYYYSTPNSPKHFYEPPNAEPGQRPNGIPPKPYHSNLPSPPLQRPSSARRTPPPRPIYFSPSNPVPSPYNTSRPQPRPGFMQRMKNKILEWIRRLARWAKRNPIKAGLATFVPVMVGAGLVRAFKGIVGLNGLPSKVFGKLGKSMGGGVKAAEKVGKEKKEWDWGLQHFVGFAGSKGGPLDGIMKILQMYMNHYAKLTPSAVPRAASILLELYFLENKL